MYISTLLSFRHGVKKGWSDSPVGKKEGKKGNYSNRSYKPPPPRAQGHSPTPPLLILPRACPHQPFPFPLPSFAEISLCCNTEFSFHRLFPHLGHNQIHVCLQHRKGLIQLLTSHRNRPPTSASSQILL